MSDDCSSYQLWSTNDNCSNMVEKVTLNDKYADQLLRIDGAYIAGGALRRFYDPEEKVNDYDVFFRDQQAKERAYNMMEMLVAQGRADCVFKCDAGLLYSYRCNGMKYQLIAKQYYRTIHALLHTFDFLPCCFATDGGEIVYIKGAPQSVKDKVLRVNRITFPYASIRRAIKYKMYGYDVRDAIVACSKIIEHSELTDEEEAIYID